ncbi:ATP-binding protein [Couchioplanes azureus]|uniref:ATP-binding protein n=1 Tax=Couchioplanes caeruleus TaxID=56438 RepID=UPI001670A788|nr:ATP-binding protein [Couchioplanes caeruleus]GGQ71602.1 hypothetical protein GCM10010166_47170 [Couchioplanes caeruleus subsp. azureus]
MPRKFGLPYLLRHAPAGADGCFSVTADVNAGVIEAAVRGRWSPSLRSTAWTAVSELFSEHPRAVIADLHDLGDPLAASAPAWWTMGMTGARMRPPVPFVVCLPPATALAARLKRLGARRQLPMFATMPEARVAVAGRLPLTERVQRCLAPQPDARRRARAMVTDACQAWRLPELLHRCRLVVSELVGNAVEHAATDIVVTVSRRGAGIHLAVSDEEPRLPEMINLGPPHPSIVDARGQGLRVVHAAATVWGTIPTPAGKVVWALVRPGRWQSQGKTYRLESPEFFPANGSRPGYGRGVCGSAPSMGAVETGVKVWRGSRIPDQEFLQRSGTTVPSQDWWSA